MSEESLGQQAGEVEIPSGLQEFSAGESFFKGVFLPALVILFIILAGVGTGWALARGRSSSGVSVEDGAAVAPGAEIASEGQEVGLKDEATFSDNAEGVLEKGGIDGEGTHHLVRAGGPSQNVYLTSSVIDLSQFEGRTVAVWGETNAAQKAGWLMDVGRLKVIK